jgi:hypothetical protein
MSEQFTVKWLDRGRPPRGAPDPDYPNGIAIDHGERPACLVTLPYMTKQHVGLWYVECAKCRANVLITMASRPDDPKSVMLPCLASNKCPRP